MRWLRNGETYYVSIHAPVKGRQRISGSAPKLPISFNPRPREGATLYPLLAPFIG